MNCYAFSIFPWVLLFLFQAAQTSGEERPVREPGSLRIERRSAGQEIDELRKFAMQTEYRRTLGTIGGLDVTVRYGAVRFQRDPLGWGLEFTTILPNLVPGPGNRRGIDIF
ncbi:MAG TPA: hypothetical protein VFG19_02155 [Geobacteraceae bacterium]|nr:hypothetical protein [Geobacteraceae bacterium]